MTAYVEETSRWKEWQREYRFGAFYIFPPRGVIEPIDALRSLYDPRSAAYCQSHISLSEPLRRPLTEAQLDELRAALSSIDAFDVQYGPLRGFPPHPGVCYAVRPEERIRQLRSVLHLTSAFAGVPLRREHVAPHLTVAEFISLERTEELLHELAGKVPEGSFRCDRIEYAVPDEHFWFARVLALELRP